MDEAAQSSKGQAVKQNGTTAGLKKHSSEHLILSHLTFKSVANALSIAFKRVEKETKGGWGVEKETEEREWEKKGERGRQQSGWSGFSCDLQLLRVLVADRCPLQQM